MNGRPRPYSAKLRRREPRMAVAHSPVGEATATFRPLLSAAAASGIMTIGVLQFMGDIWSDLPVGAREYMTMAVQGAFIGFLFQLGAIVVALLSHGRRHSRLHGLLNFYGVAAVVAGVFITGTLVSRTLIIAQPTTLEPVDSLALFTALGLLGLIAIATAALVSRGMELFRSSTGVQR